MIDFAPTFNTQPIHTASHKIAQNSQIATYNVHIYKKNRCWKANTEANYGLGRV